MQYERPQNTELQPILEAFLAVCKAQYRALVYTGVKHRLVTTQLHFDRITDQAVSVTLFKSDAGPAYISCRVFYSPVDLTVTLFIHEIPVYAVDINHPESLEQFGAEFAKTVVELA